MFPGARESEPLIHGDVGIETNRSVLCSPRAAQALSLSLGLKAQGALVPGEQGFPEGARH